MVTFNNLKVLLLYFLCTLLYTLPLLFVANHYLIGRGGLDAFLYMWNTHNFWSSVLHFHSPFYSENIFYPVGVNLLFNDSSPLISLLGFGFLGLPVLYMNLVVIFGITFSAFFSFLLVKKMTGANGFIAFVCGLIYAFSPTLGSFVYVQHNYYLVAAAFLPLSLLVLISFFEKPSKYLKRFVLIQVLLFFTNYYFFILNGFLSALFSLVFIIQERDIRKNILQKKFSAYYCRAGLFLIGCLFIVSTILLLSFQGWSDLSRESSGYAGMCNANLAGVVMPRWLMNSFGLSENGDTPVYYLGVIFILLGLIAVVLLRKEKYVFALGGSLLVILFFSFGLVWRFGDYVLLENRFTPFYYFAQLPGLGLIDCPIRFMGAVHLLLALLVGHLLKFLSSRNQMLAVTLLFICCISIASDYRIGQFPFAAVTIPDTYRYIANKEDDRTVLELSSGLTESKGGYGYDYTVEGLHTRQMFWQSIHKKPRIGGYVSRIPKSTYEFFKHQGILSDLFDLTSYQGTWSSKVYSEEEKKSFIRTFNLGYIVVAPGSRQSEYIKATEEVLQGLTFDKQEDSEHFILYELK